MKKGLPLQILKFFLAGGVFLAACLLGIQMASLTGGASPFWPASGVAFLMLLYFGPFATLAIYFLSVAFYWSTKAPLETSLLFAIGPALEALVASRTYLFIRKKWLKLGDSPELISILGAILVSVAISALNGIAILYFTNVLSNQNQLIQAFITWWTGDALGILILSPIYNLFIRSPYHLSKSSKETTKDLMQLFATVALAIGMTYFTLNFGLKIQFIFLSNIFLLIIVAIFSPRLSYIAMLAIYCASLILSFAQKGSNSGIESLNAELINLQIIFFGVTSSLIVLIEVSKARLRSFAVYILVTAWFIGGALISYTHHVENTLNESTFKQMTSEATEKLKDRIDQYTLALSFSSSLLSEAHEVKNSRWEEISKALQIDTKYPGINGIGFVYATQRSDLSNWAKNYAKRNSIPDFSIKYPPSLDSDFAKPDQAFVISAIEPIHKNKPALGLDLAAEKNRYQAAIKSIETRQPTITDEIILVQDSLKKPGFLFYYPTFHEGNFIGWAYAPFVWENFFRGFLLNEQEILEYEVHVDGKKSEQKPVTASNHFKTGKLEHSTHTYFADKKLIIHWQKGPAFPYRNNSYTAWISTVISLISLLMFSLISTILDSQEKTENLVKKREDELRDSQMQLIQASKLSSLGEMAGGIAHEINNPLAIIRGRAGYIKTLINKGSASTEKITENMEVIDRTVVRISKIIEGLRVFSRAPKEIEEPVPVSLQKIIDDTLIFCGERFKNHGIAMQLKIEPDVLVWARETQISQVFLNLLNNAFDAISKNENPWILIESEIQAEWVQVRVTDSGPGIPKDIADKIMQPFYTTKEVGKGTGLGLSISAGIMKEHGGSLLLDEKSPNTSFIVTLKIAKDSPQT